MWTIHLDEPERELAASIVGRMLLAFSEDLEQVDIACSSNKLRVSLACALAHDNNLYGIDLRVAEGTFVISLVGQKRGRGEFVRLEGGIAVSASDDLKESAKRQLQRWSTELSLQPSPEHAAEAAKLRSRLAEIIAGAAATSHPQWRMADIGPEGFDDFVITIVTPSDDERRSLKVLRFSSASTDWAEGKISPELCNEVRRLTLGRPQISEAVNAKEQGTPYIVVGAVPFVWLRNDSDAMFTLRSIRRLPPGARLIPL